MDIEHTSILWQEKNCRQFRMLTWALFISQFVHPVRGEGMGLRACMIESLF